MIRENGKPLKLTESQQHSMHVWWLDPGILLSLLDACFVLMCSVLHRLHWVTAASNSSTIVKTYSLLSRYSISKRFLILFYFISNLECNTMKWNIVDKKYNITFYCTSGYCRNLILPMILLFLPLKWAKKKVFWTSRGLFCSGEIASCLSIFQT